MGSNLASASEPDYEGEFYAIMARHQDWVEASVERLKKDTFDATRGPQVGLTTEGNVGILMVVNQRSAKMLADAFEGIMDHACEAGIQTVMDLFYFQGSLLTELVPFLDPEVQATKFFDHGDDVGE